MKKFITICLTITAVFFTSCFQPVNADDKKPIKFAFITSTLNNSFFTAISDTFSEIAKQNGDQYILIDPQYDQAKQISMMEDAINQNVDIIYLIAVDSEGIRQGLLAAKQKQIPVVVIDNPISDDDLIVSTVASDNFLAGKINGEQMAKDFPNGAKIAVIDCPFNRASVLRADGFYAGLGENKSKFNVVSQQNGKCALEVTMPIAEDIIQAHPDLQAFFAVNDPSALGVVVALKASNKLKNIKIYTVDGSPDGKKAFSDGDLTLTVAQAPIQLAKETYKVGKKVLAGEPVSKEILVPTFPITKEMIEKNGVKVWQ